MLSFFNGCAELFADMFNAALGVEFFEFLAGFLVILMAFALFRLFYRGAGRL